MEVLKSHVEVILGKMPRGSPKRSHMEVIIGKIPSGS